MIAESADLITQVKEQLIGAVREQAPRPVLLADVLRTAALLRAVDLSMLSMKINPSVAYVIADSTQLVRALGNLLQNAVEAGAKNIAVTAIPAEEAGMMLLSIGDDGAGMSVDMLSKAWTPFSSTKAGHQGLGLPAALHVISQLQGRMDVASEEGQGTQVQIWLPYVVVPTAVIDFKSEEVSSVLLLDDDDEWAQSFLSVLADAGIKTSRLDQADSLPDTDLLFVDEHSASFSMDDVLPSVKKADLADKTIVLTAALNPERVTHYINEGLRDVQPKPYRADEVAALLK
jgi:hypothetical protein